MAYSYTIISNGPNVSSSVCELVVDTLAELQDPDFPTSFGVGSDCIVLEDSSVWMLGNDKTWHLL